MAEGWVEVGVTIERLQERAATMTPLQANAFAQPLVGKRIRVAGMVHAITDMGAYIQVLLMRDGMRFAVACDFRDAAASLLLVYQGDFMLAHGVIDHLDVRVLSLKECVLVDAGTLADLKAKHGIKDEPPPAPATPPVSIEAPAPAVAASLNRGGRPAKAFWDDMWAEIARALYEGDLKPERQVDIEKAMHDWLVAHGHSAGETQVRERARKLFTLLVL